MFLHGCINKLNAQLTNPTKKKQKKTNIKIFF